MKATSFVCRLVRSLLGSDTKAKVPERPAPASPESEPAPPARETKPPSDDDSPPGSKIRWNH